MSCQDGPTCREVLEHLCELVDAEDRDGVGDDTARAWEVLAAHARGCPHCSDALDAERHLRVLLRRCCAEQEHAPESLRLRVISSTTMVWHG